MLCEYFLCQYLAEAKNSDAAENIDVMWTPRNAETRFIAVATTVLASSTRTGSGPLLRTTNEMWSKVVGPLRD